jgi:PIF1-like helicase
MLIIDEVSFAHKADIEKIDKHLRILKQQDKLDYGGINIIFCGDFCQLEPVGNNKKPIYEENVHQFKDKINCYIELDGTWRFKNDPAWGQLLSRIRDGTVSLEDIALINSKIVQKLPVPPMVRYACYYNKDKAAINTATFVERIKYSFQKYGTTAGYMLIFADNIEMKNISNVYKQFSNTHILYQSYSEDDLKFPKGPSRMDFVLKLYSGCNVMLPTNINVSMGQANGTQATVEQIVLKPNIQPRRTLINGVVPVAAVFASQVQYITLKHTNTKIQQPFFNIEPTKHSFKIKLPTALQVLNINSTFVADMRATQVPILQNTATTGHKLQGSGVETLFVHKWSNVTNWNYVMLSRVKEMKGLYAREKLPEDLTKYSRKPAYLTMIRKLASKSPTILTEEEYANLTA